MQNEGFKVNIGPEKKAAFMKQLANDVKLLSKVRVLCVQIDTSSVPLLTTTHSQLEIMDYSLLLGLHDRKRSVPPTVLSNLSSDKISRSNTPLRRDRRELGDSGMFTGGGLGGSGKMLMDGGQVLDPAIPPKRQISREPLTNVPENTTLDESKEQRESKDEYSDEYNTGESESEYDNCEEVREC